MSEIIDRLREASLEDAQASWMDPAPRWAERSQLLSDAADEIERLRVPADWTVDDTILARKILTYMGEAVENPSLHPGANQRVDNIAKIIAAHASPTPPTTEGRDYIVKIAQRLKRLAQQADPAPWSVRPQKYDDWGWIRDAEGYCVVQAKAGHDVDLDEHRRTKTDPYKGNADFIAQARNDVEAICDALLSSPRVEEVRRMREALIQARQELWDALHSHMSEAEFNKEVEYIDEALSLPDGEGKELATRASGPTAPTDRL